MKIATKTLLAVGAFLLNEGSLGCDLPAEVSVPNGATATEAEMLQGSESVKRFTMETQRFLQCLESEHQSLRTSDGNANPEHIVARENQMAREHNDAVAKMEAIMEAFNEAVRNYEARSDQDQS